MKEENTANKKFANTKAGKNSRSELCPILTTLIQHPDRFGPRQEDTFFEKFPQSEKGLFEHQLGQMCSKPQKISR